MSDPAGYPFSAIVGQPSMKRALVLAAIHPGLGGVLVRGSKGAAKSTAVRALAGILPPIEVFEGDPFHREAGEEVEGWPLPEGARPVRRPVSLVNLPVGATDDRVVGSLDIERALSSGVRAFEPGLLARAHRGLLYIDEVNLLADHVVDLLLDAAAMGVNHVEREGLAFSHPARFVLVGTMNPEEGDLRPQLLDRFGLAVDVEPMADPRRRAEVVRRRLAFEADPQAFRARWAEADRLEGERIVEARRLLPSVVVPGPILDALCARCAREGADGLRADLTIYKAASALAAYEGRLEVTQEDVEAVAELALAHRRTTPPSRGPSPQPPPPAAVRGGSTCRPSARSRPVARRPRALPPVGRGPGVGPDGRRPRRFRGHRRRRHRESRAVVAPLAPTEAGRGGSAGEARPGRPPGGRDPLGRPGRPGPRPGHRRDPPGLGPVAGGAWASRGRPAGPPGLRPPGQGPGPARPAPDPVRRRRQPVDGRPQADGPDQGGGPVAPG